MKGREGKGREGEGGREGGREGGNTRVIVLPFKLQYLSKKRLQNLPPTTF